MLGLGLVKEICTNRYGHSKTAFILGVLSANRCLDHLLSEKNSTKSPFLSQMVREVTVDPAIPDKENSIFIKKL